jgi:hypothetical protein
MPKKINIIVTILLMIMGLYSFGYYGKKTTLARKNQAPAKGFISGSMRCLMVLRLLNRPRLLPDFFN